jgi:hypothetical protein
MASSVLDSSRWRELARLPFRRQRGAPGGLTPDRHTCRSSGARPWKRAADASRVIARRGRGRSLPLGGIREVVVARGRVWKEAKLNRVTLHEACHTEASFLMTGGLQPRADSGVPRRYRSRDHGSPHHEPACATGHDRARQARGLPGGRGRRAQPLRFDRKVNQDCQHRCRL